MKHLFSGVRACSLILALGTSTLVGSSCSPPQKAKDQIDVLTVNSELASIPSDGSLILRVALKNRSSNVVCIAEHFLPGSDIFSADQVELTHDGKRVVVDDEALDRRNSPKRYRAVYIVFPGEDLAGAELLNRVYGSFEPGVYAVRFRFPVYNCSNLNRSGAFDSMNPGVKIFDDEQYAEAVLSSK